MKNKWLRLLGLALVLCVLLSTVAGCKPTDDGDKTPTTTTTTVEDPSQYGFYDADGNYYPYFDEDGDYIWDGFKDADDKVYYFFDENGDGTPDGYTDEEGNRSYYDGSGDGDSDKPVISQQTTTKPTTGNGTTATAGKNTTVTKDKVTTVTKDNGTATTTGKQNLSSKEMYKAVRGSTVKIQYAGEVNAIEKKKIKAFELAYGCKVETSVVAWNDFKNQFLAMVAAGTVPDTVGIPDETYLKWVSKGLLQPIDDYVNINDAVWSKEIWDAFSWKGKHYGIGGANGVTPMFCIYNASLFKAKGVKTPMEYYKENNWNFDTFKKTAIAMTYGDVVGASVSWRYLLHLCNGNTAVNIDAANGKVTNALTEKSAITATELLVDLKRGGYVTFESPFDLFGNAQIAMVLERPWNIIGQFDLRNTTLKNAEIEIAPLPKGPDAKKEYSINIMNANGVPTKAQNPLGACAWYYFGVEYQKSHENDADIVAARRLTYTDEQYKFAQDYVKNHPSINTFVYGVGNWYSDDWGYWASMILDGLSVQAANDKFKGEFQSMINTLGNA